MSDEEKLPAPVNDASALEADVEPQGAPPDRRLGSQVGSTAFAVDGEPPVVARLVIEIRSDGTRTIARGAMEDRASGEKVAIEARGTTPVALASSMMRSLAGALRKLPAMLITGGKKR